MEWGRTAAVALALSAATAGAAAQPAAAARHARPLLANRCFTLAASSHYVSATPSGGYRAAGRKRRNALRFYLKPTGLGTYLLYDAGGRLMTAGDGAAVKRGSAPAPAAEWTTRPRRRGSYALRSTSTGRI